MGTEGIDAPAVTRWLSERVAEVDPPLRFSPIPGGRSNLTYTVTDDAGRRWVLRRPPLHSVLESAHDVGREARIMSALAESAVPVPAVVGSEPNPEVTGAPFFVMDHVEGVVARDADAVRDGLPRPAREHASAALVATLVALHDVDVDAVGLGDLAKRQEYVARQLRRWSGQLREGSTRELPLLEEVHARLAADVPVQRDVAIVHGDYRLDNLIVAPTGDVRAVLDWELCTLGDPLADVGTLHVYWAESAEDDLLPLGEMPTIVDGFWSRAQVARAYAETSGRDLSELDYYVAFAFWRLAVILEGVHTRFTAGAYEHDDDGIAEMADTVVELGEAAAQAATRAGR